MSKQPDCCCYCPVSGDGSLNDDHEYIMACGCVCNAYDYWFRTPTEELITCEACKESQVYKEDQIQFEVGFEQDRRAWSRWRRMQRNG